MLVKLLPRKNSWGMIWAELRSVFGDDILQTRNRSLMECDAYNTTMRIVRRRNLEVDLRGYQLDQVECSFELTDEERGYILPSLINRNGVLNGRRL